MEGWKGDRKGGWGRGVAGGKAGGAWRTMKAGGLIAAAVCCFCLGAVHRGMRVEMTGPMGNGAGPSSAREGSNGLSFPTWAGNRRMRNEMNFHVGAPGWGNGPDYYSTERWDNSPVYPSNLHSLFDPYVGKAACPKCQTQLPVTRELSCTPRCDYSVSSKAIRNILKLDTWWHSPEFSAARYKDYHWIGTQMQYFVTSNPESVVVVPPCFFPRLAKAELHALNTAVYQLGASLLVVGGLSGANFISQNLAGTDGFGYVDSAGAGMDFSERFEIDTVYSDGPFYMQNAAVTTEFYYGAKILEGLSTTIGVPARQLPSDTVHYYMSSDEISVVFEIPAGAGRILFIGYDYIDMAPHWIDCLLLANRELQIEMQERSLPWLKESRSNGQHDVLRPAPGSVASQLHAVQPPADTHREAQQAEGPKAAHAVDALHDREAGRGRQGGGRHASQGRKAGSLFNPVPDAVKVGARVSSSTTTSGEAEGKKSSARGAKPAVAGGAQPAQREPSDHDWFIEEQIRKAMRELNKQRCPPGNNFGQCGPEKREYGPDPDDAAPGFKAQRPHQILSDRIRPAATKTWSSRRIRDEIKGLSLHDFDLTDRGSWEY